MFFGCTVAQKPQQPVGELLQWQTDMNAAMSLARKEKRLVFAEVSTEWCPYCKFVEEKIFTVPNVLEKLKEFSLVRFDGDKAENQPLMDKWNVSGFPTFIIFDSRGIELKRFYDADSADDFLKLINVSNKKDEEGTLSENAASPKKVRELISKFPNSAHLPDYYKKLADFYSVPPIKANYLKKAAGIIEGNLKKIDQLDEKTARITLDQHVDLLAGIYEKLGRYSLVERTYATGAQICERLVNKDGGIENNQHLLTTAVNFYLSSSDPDAAVRFLDNAMKNIPDYWPVYSSYAKVMLAKNNLKQAAEYAKKGLELADAIAKPRVSLIMAEISATGENYEEAISILEETKKNLNKNGLAKSGRAGTMLKKLDERIKEYGDFI